MADKEFEMRPPEFQHETFFFLVMHPVSKVDWGRGGSRPKGRWVPTQRLVLVGWAYRAFFFVITHRRILSHALLNFFWSRYLSFYLSFVFSWCHAFHSKKACSKYIPFTFIHIDKSGKPRLIVDTNFICPSPPPQISGQTLKCTVLSCPGSR